MSDPTLEPALTEKQLEFRKVLGYLVPLVRQQLRDMPELNRLLAGKESSDQDIATAIALTVDDFNATPPLLSPAFTLASFPSVDLLIDGAIARILRSVAYHQVRNNLSYSDGQVSVNSNDKGPLLYSWANDRINAYEAKKLNYKASYNVQRALSGGYVSSELALIAQIQFDTNGDLR